MADPAMIMPSKPPVQNQRGMKPVPTENADGGEDNAQSGFSDLLNAIEEVVSASDQVVAVPQEAPAPLPGGFMPFAGGAAPERGDGQAYRLTPFKEIRSLINAELKPLPARRDPVAPGARGSADLPFLTGQQPLTPSQIAALGGIEEAQVLPRTVSPQDIAAFRAEIQPVLSTRTDASLAQQATHETSNPVVRQVAANLQYVARGEMERLRFDLHPEELGRVQIQLQKTGTITRVTVVTETAQAFELLKSGAHALQQNLAQAGFDADDLHFESREDRGEGRQAEADERREQNERRAAREELEERREFVVRAADRRDRTIFL